MFNRKIEVRLVKDNKKTEDTPSIPKERINIPALAREVAKPIVIGTVVIIASTIVLSTLSAIAIAEVEATLTD